jgi:sec-independent protein translocase protein TatA
MPEMVMIFVIILLLFGAKKLPELAREFKKAREDFEREITTAETEVKTKTPEVKEPAGKESQAS